MNLQLNNTPKVRRRLINWLEEKHNDDIWYCDWFINDKGDPVEYPTKEGHLKFHNDQLPVSAAIGLLREFVEAEGYKTEVELFDLTNNQVQFCNDKVGITGKWSDYDTSFMTAFWEWAKIREEEL